MRKFFILMSILALFVLLSPSVFAGDPLKILPTDGNGEVAAAGSATTTWWDTTATDGTFNQVSLPSGVECKVVFLQVVSTSTTDYENGIGFHYSTTGESSQNFSKFVGGVSISVGKASGSLGYVRAASGNRIAVTVLY